MENNKLPTNLHFILIGLVLGISINQVLQVIVDLKWVLAKIENYLLYG
jgi:hypothetical protein